MESVSPSMRAIFEDWSLQIYKNLL
jgi:hypothetical protein